MKKILTTCFLSFLVLHLTSVQIAITSEPTSKVLYSYSNKLLHTTPRSLTEKMQGFTKKPFLLTQEFQAVKNTFLMKDSLGKKMERYTVDTVISGNYMFSAPLADGQKIIPKRFFLAPAINILKIKRFNIHSVSNALIETKALDLKSLAAQQKSNTAYGTTGSVSLSAGYGAQQKASTSLHITHRARKLSLYVDYHFLHNHSRQTFYNYRKIEYQNSITQTWDTIIRNPFLLHHTASVGVAYTLNSKTKVSSVLSGFSNTVKVKDESIRTTILKDDQTSTPIHLTHQERNHWHHLKGNLSFYHQFSKDHEINVELGYLRYYDNNPHQFAQINSASTENTPGINPFTINRKIPIGVGVGSANFVKNFTKQSKLELGLKGTMTSLGNHLGMEKFNQDTWQTDSSASYQLNMRENIGAAFLTMNHQLNTNTKLQMGLRWEYTNTQVRTAKKVDLVQRRSTNLLPSLSISRELAKGSSLQFSYTRSLNRPSYNNLAAYIFPVDPFSGNMALRSSIVDVLAATYRLKETYHVTLGYSYHTNPVIPLQIHINPQTNQQSAQAENFKSAQNLYLTFSFHSNINLWWQLQGNAYGNWQQYRTLYEGTHIQVQKMYSNLNIVHTFKFPHDFSAKLTGFYQTSSLFGIGYLKAFGGLNVGVEKRLKKDQGTFKFTADDLFGTMRIMLINHQPDLQLNHWLQARFVEPRIIRFTYSRTLGNRQVKRIPNFLTTSEEENNRAIK